MSDPNRKLARDKQRNPKAIQWENRLNLTPNKRQLWNVNHWLLQWVLLSSSIVVAVSTPGPLIAHTMTHNGLSPDLKRQNSAVKPLQIHSKRMKKRIATNTNCKEYQRTVPEHFHLPKICDSKRSGRGCRPILHHPRDFQRPHPRLPGRIGVDAQVNSSFLWSFHMFHCVSFH